LIATSSEEPNSPLAWLQIETDGKLPGAGYAVGLVA